MRRPASNTERPPGRGALGWLSFLALWYAVVAAGLANEKLLPYPHEIASAWLELVLERGFLGDVAVSIRRILVSFAIAGAVAVPLGVLMGAFLSVEALLNPLWAPRAISRRPASRRCC